MVLTQSAGTVLGNDRFVSSTPNGGWEYLLHQLAYAMSKPESRPMFLDRDNQGAGTCASVSEAFVSRRAFATEMIPEIIPIDLDTDQTSIEDVSGYLDQKRIPYLVCRSGGAVTPGVARHHVFLWVPDEEQRVRLVETLKGWLSGIEVRPGQRMRPPGAPHRSGIGMSRPIDMEQAQKFLAQLESPDRNLPRPLPPDIEQLLIDGPPTKHRAPFDITVVWRLIPLGYSDLEIIRLAYSGQYPFSDKARGMGIASPDSLSYLERTIGKVRAKTTERYFASRGDVDSWLAKALCWANQADPDQFGTTYTRRVFVACLEAFRDRHTNQTALSYRRVASLAQVAKTTAGKHLRVLARRGWLLNVLPGRPGKSADASVYMLNVPKITPFIGHDGGVTIGMGRLPELPSNPIFMSGYLNESGRTVANAMGPGDDMSRKELMEATGLRSSTLYDALNRLMEEPYLLIEKVRHGHYRRTDRTIADLEYTTDAEITASHRENMFQLERQGYDRYLTEAKRKKAQSRRTLAGFRVVEGSQSAERIEQSDQHVPLNTGATT